MSRKQVHNTEKAVSYLLEELLSEDDGSTDLESSNDDECNPDFVPNHYDLVEENPTMSPPLSISVQNTDTSDNKTKDLSDDVDSTGVSVILPELHTTAYDWNKVKINYEFSQFLFHEGPVEEHFIDCNSPCDFLLSFSMRKLEKTLFFNLTCTYNKSKRENQYSL